MFARRNVARRFAKGLLGRLLRGLVAKDIACYGVWLAGKGARVLLLGGIRSLYKMAVVVRGE